LGRAGGRIGTGLDMRVAASSRLIRRKGAGFVMHGTNVPHVALKLSRNWRGISGIAEADRKL
jgi:hypothetical protein